MNILGINGLGVLPSACIVQDGKLVAFSEEERFTRYKGSWGLMPAYATKFCLNYAGLSLKDIDYIAFGWDCNKYTFRLPLFLVGKYISRSPKFQGKSNLSTFIGELVKYQPSNVRRLIFEMCKLAGLPGKTPPIRFIDHHEAHAASTFYCSGLQDSHVFVFDGSGEDVCTSVYRGTAQGLELKDKISIPDSLGWFYQTFTEYLGFLPNSHEGKVMGLAAYGRYDADLAEKVTQILAISGLARYRFSAEYSFLGVHSSGRVFSELLVKLLGKPRFSGELIEQRHKDIAFAVQNKLEEVVSEIVSHRLSQDRECKNVCIAGGVGLNCKTNGVVNRLYGVENIYVPPFPSDAGTAIGAALVLSKRMGEHVSQHIPHAYWGSSYTDQQVENRLKNGRIGYKVSDNIAEDVAQLLAEDKIVGWFQGRMESGARALGARSILANPCRPETRDIVNENVKNRELWRPFAASILDEKKNEYVLYPSESPFMAISFEVTDFAKKKIPAAIHVDGTTRPQFLKKETNPLYWEMIYRFGQKTGVYAVLNTSFNTNEEPIVESPEQAIKSFFASGMDCLAIGNFIIKK